MHYTIEACVDSLPSAIAAQETFIGRIELCSSLVEGGITPSHGLLTAVCRRLSATSCKVHVLIRPRPGDFIYTPEELEIMKADILHAASCGAHGVVLGLLTPAAKIDTDRLRVFVDLCAALGLDVTFHRAFDVVRDQMAALNDLISCNVKRVLTSGGAVNAMEGLEQIAGLVKEGQGRISVMAGGGLNQENIIPVVRYTGISEVHGTFRMKEASSMQWFHPLVHFAPTPSSYLKRSPDESLDSFLIQGGGGTSAGGKEGQGDPSNWETWVTDVECLRKVRNLLEDEEDEAELEAMG